ncbi:MAG: hypothetical protein ABSE50_10930, partial [Xanthobacteraceae bacterium]
ERPSRYRVAGKPDGEAGISLVIESISQAIKVDSQPIDSFPEMTKEEVVAPFWAFSNVQQH